MSRTIHADVITEIAKDNFQQVTLISIAFDTTVYLTNGFHDISYSGNSYEAGGHFLGITQIKESSDVRVGNIKVTLSGVNQAYVSIVLSQNIIEKEVLIYRAYLDSSNAIIGDPLLNHKGKITGFTIGDDEKESNIELTVASHWGDFDKISGRRTNTNSQKLFFPNDKGFEFSGSTVKDLKWGRP